MLYSSWMFNDIVSAAVWKAGLTSDKLGYIAREIFKQSVEGASWFLLTAYNKHQEESDRLKESL